MRHSAQVSGFVQSVQRWRLAIFARGPKVMDPRKVVVVASDREDLRTVKRLSGFHIVGSSAYEYSLAFQRGLAKFLVPEKVDGFKILEKLRPQIAHARI